MNYDKSIIENMIKDKRHIPIAGITFLPVHKQFGETIAIYSIKMEYPEFIAITITEYNQYVRDIKLKQLLK